MLIKKQITFLLNDELLTIETPPVLVALDYLRKNKHLTGTKEGCKEGDCGACTVMVGELISGEVKYKPVTSCLLPMGELHGKHLVSIEGLNMNQPSPVQTAMVDCGGTQCGYCTPGFVVAMTAGLMDEEIPLNKKGADYAISGNLCRCTGYRSIKEAGIQAIDHLAPKLKNKPRIPTLCDIGALPNSFQNVSEKLAKIPPLQDSTLPDTPSLPFVAGGTDLLVQRGEELADDSPSLINNTPIAPIVEKGEYLVVDARTSFEDFANDPLIQKAVPDILSYNDLIASWPIRNRATLGGNICNASPIADMTSLLLALEAELEIESPETNRLLPLKNFFIGYKQLAKEGHEQISNIHLPKPKTNTFINWEKVSKRKILDIATINSAAKIVIGNEAINEVHLSIGGVAATPLYLTKTSQSLAGKTLSTETVLEAVDLAQSEFNPISDVRGSAQYKRLLSRQLLIAHFTKLFPETISEEAINASL
ncbi:FAD binding domain-containing protein [Puniceicoccaceae bacterium K14]|nr:FAD binding domain-containing protein [Puniceicoccaceae bacterium K14]